MVISASPSSGTAGRLAEVVAEDGFGEVAHAHPEKVEHHACHIRERRCGPSTCLIRERLDEHHTEEGVGYEVGIRSQAGC